MNPIPKTPPPMPPDDQLRVGVQKMDGRLFDASAQRLCNWGFHVPAGDKSERHALSVISSDWGPVSLLTCRLKDVIRLVSQGRLDIGIVSNDDFVKWRHDNPELSRRTIPHVLDLGPAGSSLMLGVRADLMGQDEATWEQALRYCIQYKIPVLTSDVPRCAKFLRKQKLVYGGRKRRSPTALVEHCEGTVEAQGVLFGTPLICDLVGSGKSMRDNGYMPVRNLEITESRVFLIGSEPSQPRRREVYRAVWARARTTTL